MALSRSRHFVVAALGLTQILAWGSTFYLLAVLAKPIAADTGWSLGWIVGGVSLGLLVAGLISPKIGRLIQRHGGRPVLAASSVLLALGLAVLAISPSLPVYLCAWLVIGLGMGTGLYDAAFATLGRLYGDHARSSMTNLTVIAGFSSTICWPLSAYLVEHAGWRAACGIYAGLELLVCLPLHVRLIPSLAPAACIGIKPGASAVSPLVTRAQRPAFWLLAVILTLGAVIGSMLSVHLLTLLQARGITLAGAVALGTLVGPSQVGARLVESIFGSRYHPIWTMLGSVVLVVGGVTLLLAEFPVAAAAVVLYGAGVGVGYIAKGTLPLAVFGSAHYATLMGRLALPSLLAQAFAPSLGAVLIEVGGATLVLSILAATAVLNVGLVVALGSVVSRTARKNASIAQ